MATSHAIGGGAGLHATKTQLGGSKRKPKYAHVSTREKKITNGT